MIKSQDKYFAKDINDEYFIIHQYSEVEEDVVEPIPEMVIKLVKRFEIEDKFIDYAVIKEVAKTKYLIAKNQINGADRIMIMDWYSIPKEEWKEYLYEPIDSFFERFRIR